LYTISVILVRLRNLEYIKILENYEQTKGAGRKESPEKGALDPPPV
jgi:hypothetical protein